MSNDVEPSGYTRRGLVRAGAGAAVAGAIASGSGVTLAQESPYDGYLSDVGNFDGTTVDATGQSEVTIEVGAQGNGGGFAFSPPAVQVDPGTTVVWEWTGEGGSHNVVDEAGNFESELVGEAGFTFEQAFEEPGVRKYYCNPHKGLGMKGVVAVGDTAQGGGGGQSGDGGSSGGEGEGSGGEGSEGSGGEGGESGGDSGSGPAAGSPLAAQTLIAMLVLGFLSPIVFLLLVRRKLKRPPNA